MKIKFIYICAQKIRLHHSQILLGQFNYLSLARWLAGLRKKEYLLWDQYSLLLKGVSILTLENSGFNDFIDYNDF